MGMGPSCPPNLNGGFSEAHGDCRWLHADSVGLRNLPPKRLPEHSSGHLWRVQVSPSLMDLGPVASDIWGVSNPWISQTHLYIVELQDTKAPYRYRSQTMSLTYVVVLLPTTNGGFQWGKPFQ